MLMSSKNAQGTSEKVEGSLQVIVACSWSWRGIQSRCREDVAVKLEGSAQEPTLREEGSSTLQDSN